MCQICEFLNNQLPIIVVIDHHLFWVSDLEWQVLSAEEFPKPMLEKLIWIAAFMLVGARHPGATVGMVEKDHRDEVAFFFQIKYIFIKLNLWDEFANTWAFSFQDQGKVLLFFPYSCKPHSFLVAIWK